MVDLFQDFQMIGQIRAISSIAFSGNLETRGVILQCYTWSNQCSGWNGKLCFSGTSIFFISLLVKLSEEKSHSIGLY